MYHAACKVEFWPFNRSYSQMTFFNFFIKSLTFIRSIFFMRKTKNVSSCEYDRRVVETQLIKFASCVMRQTPPLGALALHFICNIWCLWVYGCRYSVPQVLWSRPFARVLYTTSGETFNVIYHKTEKQKLPGTSWPHYNLCPHIVRPV